MGKKERKEREAHDEVMRQAAYEASRLFEQHEAERKHTEHIDKLDLDNELFIGELERIRLEKERNEYLSYMEDMDETRKIVLQEHNKYISWDHVSDYTWLPDSESQSDVNAFLSSWKELTESNNFYKKDSHITAILKEDKKNTHKERVKIVEEELAMCNQGKLLSDEILKHIDKAYVENNYTKYISLRESLRLVYLQLIASIDKITAYILQYCDSFLDSSEETITLWSPREPNEAYPECEKPIKYGLWARMRVNEMTRHLPMIKFKDIAVSLEPKEGSQRLPRALGLARDNAALRCVQLSFDPFSAFIDEKKGQEYFALDCILIIDPLVGHEKFKTHHELIIRVNTPSSHVLNKIVYKPQKITDGIIGDESELKVSFQIPQNVVIRHLGNAYVGIWDELQLKWNPIQNRCVPQVLGRTSITTSQISVMSIIQKKGYDMPYSCWHLYPLGDDSVMYIIEGNDASGEKLQDREIKIIVKDHECRLFSPNNPELASLREKWWPPATLLRILAKSGYNLLLNDADASFLDIPPKCKEIETKGYSDIALFCSNFSFTSSKHNKSEVIRENDCITLFRISKNSRKEGDAELLLDVENVNVWQNIRYEKERCVLASFSESDKEPNLSNLPGKDSHLNLFMLLHEESGDPMGINTFAYDSNKILQRSVYQLLILTRPFSWG